MGRSHGTSKRLSPVVRPTGWEFEGIRNSRRRKCGVKRRVEILTAACGDEIDERVEREVGREREERSHDDVLPPSVAMFRPDEAGTRRDPPEAARKQRKQNHLRAVGGECQRHEAWHAGKRPDERRDEAGDRDPAKAGMVSEL